jgi:hypothetical protein
LAERTQHRAIASDVPNAEQMAPRPPEIDEQTDEVLTEFGFSASDVVLVV